MKIILIASLTSVFLLVQRLPAQSANAFLDPRNGVTESGLVIRALASNPALAADRQEIEMAKGGVVQAGLRKNPSLTAGGMKEVAGGDNRVSVGGRFRSNCLDGAHAAPKSPSGIWMSRV